MIKFSKKGSVVAIIYSRSKQTSTSITNSKHHENIAWSQNYPSLIDNHKQDDLALEDAHK